MKLFSTILAVAVVSAVVAISFGGVQQAVAGEPRLEAVTPGTPGPITGPAADAMRYGPLPADRAELAQRKAQANAEASVASPRSETQAGAQAPTIVIGKNGV